MTDLYVELAAAVLGAGGVGALAWKSAAGWLSSLKHARLKRKHQAGLDNITRLYQILNKILVLDDCVSRSMIVRSTNGGGIPGPGCTVTLSTVNEVYKTEESGESFSTLWQDRQADQYCTAYLKTIAREGVLHLQASEIPEDATIRPVYEALNAYRSESYLIATRKDAMFYLSITYCCSAELSVKDKAILDAAVSEIRDLFHK